MQIEQAIEILKKEKVGWPSWEDTWLFSDLFTITHNNSNIFIEWKESWKNHAQEFPLSVIERIIGILSPITSINKRFSKAYIYSDDHGYGIYLCINV